MGQSSGEYASRASEVLDTRARRILAERAAASAVLAAAALAQDGGARLAGWVFVLGAASGLLAAVAYRWIGPQRGQTLACASIALDILLASALVRHTGGAASPAFALYLLAFTTPLVFRQAFTPLFAGPAAAVAFVLASLAAPGPIDRGDLLFRLAVLGAGTIAARRMQADRQALLLDHDRRVQELSAINFVAHELTSILDPDALTWRVVWLVRQRFGHAEVRIGRRAGDRLQVRSADGATVESRPLDGASLLCEAARTGVTAVRELGETGPVGVAIPLLVAGRVLGALEIEARPTRTFGDRDVRSLEAVAAFTAIALENAELHQSAIRSALTDPLTGLFNVRYLQDALGAALARAEAADRPFSLLMLDVDNLRDVNNRCGHLTGDRALREVARIIAAATRTGDIAARYGGDEFLLALADAGPDAAAAVAERVRLEVEAIRLVHRGEPIPLTVSVGVASHPSDGRSLDSLVEAADRAAYRAKARGRNRIALLSAVDAPRALGEAAVAEGPEPT